MLYLEYSNDTVLKIALISRHALLQLLHIPSSLPYECVINCHTIPHQFLGKCLR